ELGRRRPHLLLRLGGAGRAGAAPPGEHEGGGGEGDAGGAGDVRQGHGAAGFTGHRGATPWTRCGRPPGPCAASCGVPLEIGGAKLRAYDDKSRDVYWTTHCTADIPNKTRACHGQTAPN